MPEKNYKFRIYAFNQLGENIFKRDIEAPNSGLAIIQALIQQGFPVFFEKHLGRIEIQNLSSDHPEIILADEVSPLTVL